MVLPNTSLPGREVSWVLSGLLEPVVVFSLITMLWWGEGVERLCLEGQRAGCVLHETSVLCS